MSPNNSFILHSGMQLKADTGGEKCSVLYSETLNCLHVSWAATSNWHRVKGTQDHEWNMIFNEGGVGEG